MADDPSQTPRSFRLVGLLCYDKQRLVLRRRNIDPNRNGELRKKDFLGIEGRESKYQREIGGTLLNKEAMKFRDKVLLFVALAGLSLYILEQLWIAIYEWEMLW